MLQQKALLINFEGIDGAGKSTQIADFCRFLDEKQLNYVCLREPGGTILGEEIRKLLKSTNPQLKIADLAELLLFSAARVQIIQEKIKPALAAQKIVILDRFIDSTLAYQGGGRALNYQTVKSICQLVLGNLQIDRTYYLDLDRKAARERLQQAGDIAQDRLDLIDDLAFWQQIRNVYLDLAKTETSSFGQRYLCLDATRPIEIIQKQIRQDFTKILENQQN